MQPVNRFVGISLACLLSTIGINTFALAQDQSPMVIQAVARGTSTQLGQMVHVNIHIDGFSNENDRKVLIDGFNRSGQRGLISALEDMKSKGTFGTPYGVGNEIKYIIELPPENGRRHIRLITNRRIAFQELHNSTRSADYTVGTVDLYLTPDGKNSEGTALPAAKLTVNKKKQQIEIETFQNPWKLTNLIVSKK